MTRMSRPTSAGSSGRIPRRDNRPEILKAFVPLSKAFFFGREGTVDHRLKELIRLKIAEINQCHY